MTTRRTLANALRMLSIDGVQKSNSGHPGAPMGMADIAEVLWRDFLNHNPTNPSWADRDRFVLSNGHDADAIKRAVEEARKVTDKPSLRAWLSKRASRTTGSNTWA